MKNLAFNQQILFPQYVYLHDDSDTQKAHRSLVVMVNVRPTLSKRTNSKDIVRAVSKAE